MLRFCDSRRFSRTVGIFLGESRRVTVSYGVVNYEHFFESVFQVKSYDKKLLEFPI